MAGLTLKQEDLYERLVPARLGGGMVWPLQFGLEYGSSHCVEAYGH